MSTLKQFQREISSRLHRGDTFASVEDEVIDPSALSEAEKAALWLYGWSFVSRRLQRLEAVRHLELLSAREEAAEPAPGGSPFAGLSPAR